MSPAASLTLAYVVPAYKLDVKVVLTNKVPVTPIRGAGQPQGVFVMERLLDELASARKTLAAAGVTLTEEIMPCGLGADEERALALGLREAVTNVVRHSRAAGCRTSHCPS